MRYLFITLQNFLYFYIYLDGKNSLIILYRQDCRWFIKKLYLTISSYIITHVAIYINRNFLFLFMAFLLSVRLNTPGNKKTIFLPVRHSDFVPYQQWNNETVFRGYVGRSLLEIWNWRLMVNVETYDFKLLKKEFFCLTERRLNSFSLIC